MPITKGAIRKLRADRAKTKMNLSVKKAYKAAITAMRSKPTLKKLEKVYSTIDRAAKVNIVHKNTAARLKSRLAKLLRKK